MNDLFKIRFLVSLLSLASLLALTARADEIPQLLADIHPGPLNPLFVVDFSAPPSGFFQIGSLAFFSTASRNSPDEGMLWRTDGTPGGTAVVSSSICPFPCHKLAPVASWHGLTFLEVDSGDQILAARLWRTDGTAAGTIPLSGPFFHSESFFSIVAHSSPELDVLFFTACGPRGCQLWRSDGTAAGTALLRHPDSRPFENAQELTFWRGRLYFLGDHVDASGLTDQGLWSTDGTPAGTVFVSDVVEGDYPSLVVATPSHLFFTSGPSGEDLWVTAGVPGDAHRIADLDQPACGPPPSRDCDPPAVQTLAAFGDAVYFETLRTGHGGEIWRSDGTEAGTGPVLETPAMTQIADLHPLGSGWIFSVTPPGGPAALWTADGGFTRGSPLAGCAEGCPAFAGSIDFPSAGSWIFAGTDSAHGTEPWITDGTGPGTRRLADACPGTCSGVRFIYSYPTGLGSEAGRTWFHAYSSADAEDVFGDELWVTDGTPGGTRRVAGHVDGIGFVKDLVLYGITNTQTSTADLWAADASGASHPVAVLRTFAAGSYSDLLPFRDGALLLADEGQGVSQLWKSDGTPAGTVPLYRFEPGSGRSFTSFLATLGPLELLAVTHKAGPEDDPRYLSEIWRTDGTTRHTQKVIDFPQGTFIGFAFPWQGKLLFEVVAGLRTSFWTSDGTPSGTREILTLPPGIRDLSAAVSFGSRFLFVASTKTGRYLLPQVFVSDGTAAGTRQISDIREVRQPLFDDRPVQVGGTVFFRLNDPLRNARLWRTDGTPEGTRLVSPLLGVDDVYAFQGALYFTAFLPPAGDGRGLYRIALPGGSPVLLSPVVPPGRPFDSNYPAARFAPLGNRLLFVGTDSQGIEPWVTDGTPEGTHRVLDVQPGTGSSNPSALVSAGSRVFFNADDGTHGRELWESDGTPEGTRMVADLAPGGIAGLSYYYFGGAAAFSNGVLYFDADDGTTGVEPWALRVEP